MVEHPSHAPFSVPAIKAFPDRLHVVTVLFNPLRYRARYRNYRAFQKHVEDSGAVLHTVEAAFGGREFEVTEAGNPLHVQVRTGDELWLKESLLNLGISRLGPEARYIAIVDADIAFQKPHWAQETLQVLQHHPVAQMFSAITYLNPEDEPLHTMESFAERWINGNPIRVGDAVIQKDVFHGRRRGNAVVASSYDQGTMQAILKNAWGQPGGAWAFRREALDQVGGLMDYCILGSADSLMAFGILGKVREYIARDGYSGGYVNELLAWEERAVGAFRRNIGVVRGGITHYWHGPMKDRRYGERNRILRETAFDPRRDLKRDTQGLWRLHDDGSERFVKLRDDLRSYFTGRNEDSIECGRLS